MLNLKDLSMKDLRKLKDMDKDDLLELVGLQTRSSGDWILPTLGAFSLGALVGVGVGLLLAPKPGSELQKDLRNRLQGAADQMQSGISSATSAMSERPSTPRPL